MQQQHTVMYILDAIPAVSMAPPTTASSCSSVMSHHVRAHESQQCTQALYSAVHVLAQFAGPWHTPRGTPLHSTRCAAQVLQAVMINPTMQQKEIGSDNDFDQM